MPHVVALYRYPLKGFTPEDCETLTVLDDGRIAGDRVLGVRFADTDVPDDVWSRKHGMLALINTPGLARLRVTFDAKTLRLRITNDTLVLADQVLNPDGRRHIADVLADYVIKLEGNPVTNHPERLPLRVIGDGYSPRYHDEEEQVFKGLKVCLGKKSASCAFARMLRLTG